MGRRLALPLLVAAVVATGVVTPAGSTPVTTTVRTIQDVDADNRLEYAPGEDYTVVGEDDSFRPPANGSIINFLQLSDFQMVDEESPARVEFLDTTQRGPFTPFSAAYRPQESLTTQVSEAMVRAARNTVSPITHEQLDLTILTGDNADSQQYNETRWFIDILDGDTFVDPNSGIPIPGCEATPGSIYDGVKGGGQGVGYYDPDESGPTEDGDGYSPNRAENISETGRDVTVRDFPGLFDAANHRFRAIGVDMPWYSAFGNHDALIQGNSHEAYTGPFGPAGETWISPFNVAMHEIATGCVKPSNLAASDLFREPGDPTEGASTVFVPPDARRCFLTKAVPPTPSPIPPSPCDDSSFILEHFNTTGQPLGHGFAPGPCDPSPPDAEVCEGYGRPPVAIANHDGYYSFSPVQGLRFVTLDTVTDECGPPFAGLCSEGSVDDPQFQWLERQLLLAEQLGEYVMVFSHHTLKTTRWPSADPSEYPVHYGQRVDRENAANPQNVSLVTLEELFCQHPNLIAHIAGHEHENYVQHYACTGPEPLSAIGPSAAFGGFWHVSTAAHIDWPQQSRMIELVDNGDGTTSLVLTILDHAGPPNPGGAPAFQPGRGHAGEQVLHLASIGRELAYNDYQGSRAARGDSPTDRNAIIVMPRPWPYPAA